MFEYQKIAESTNDYVVDNKNNKIFSNKTGWIVTEKIHGSNFAIYFRDGNISFSKRNAILNDYEWFYNYQSIKDKLIKNIKELHDIIDSDNFVVYGELFGGWYPDNPEEWNGAMGKRINKSGACTVPFEDRAIQEGIYYSPNIEYIVFDVAIIKEDKIDFVTYSKMVSLLSKTGFNFTKLLFTGNLSSALKFNLNFNSTIPSSLGHKKLKPGTNIAEGIVIKPLVDHYVKDKNGIERRCIIKIKHPNFKETHDSFDINEANRSYKFIFSTLINQNRYQAVLSKFGKITNNNENEFIEKFNDDAWDCFYEKYSSNVIISDYDASQSYTKNLCKNIIKNNTCT